MKIAVISYSGNTGKTTLAKNMLVPLIPGAQRIQIEDINTGDGKADIELNAQKFKALAEMLNIADDDEHYVIDIGASNSKRMIEEFIDLKRTRNDIDFWVIPCVPAAKQKADSINTVVELIRIGIQAEKIIVIPNNVSEVDNFEFDFRELQPLKANGVHVLQTPVLASDIYDMLKGEDKSVFEIEAENPDFKAMKKAARESGNPEDLAAVGRRMVVQDMAEAAAHNLRLAFKTTPMAADFPVEVAFAS